MDNSNHFVKKCKDCNVVINQCRCPDLNKKVIWGFCNKCKKKEKED